MVEHGVVICVQMITRALRTGLIIGEPPGALYINGDHGARCIVGAFANLA